MPGLPLRDRLDLANRAAAVCVTRPGGVPAIPTLAELDPA